MSLKHLSICFLLLASLRADDLARHSRTLLDQHAEARVVPGRDGWRFLANELRHLAKGVEWIAPADPPEPPHRDPLPALRALNTQLEEMGIALIVVPVPAKAAVYPEQLPGEAPKAVQSPAPFVARLQREDFLTVDLRGVFSQKKAETQLYCRTDTHWSPRGAELAAERVARLIDERELLKDIEPVEITADESGPIRIKGDLSEEGAEPETLPARGVRRADGGELDDDTSPILLLGDSHTLVFSTGGDMHARNAGFLEHLALRSRQPVDRVANRGSASTPPRMTLYRTAARDAEWLENKRVVVYLFTARELTESLNGWRVLPIAPRFR